MTPNEPQSEKREFYKRLRLVLITAVVTIVVYKIVSYDRPLSKMFMSQAEYHLDTSGIVPPPVKEDSVSLTSGKVSVSEFESHYSAESWYNEYKANNVSFNDAYDKKRIDVFGKIKDISTSWVGYSIVRLSTGDDFSGDIICDNIRNDKDAWKTEVKNLSVGNTVHIRGYFAKLPFDADNMHMEKCHVIIDSVATSNSLN